MDFRLVKFSTLDKSQVSFFHHLLVIALAEALGREGFRMVAGGTDNHLVLIDLRTFDEELTGKVAFVYTHPLSKGGSSSGHYGGNPETYMNVGEAMGKAMVELLQGK